MWLSLTAASPGAAAGPAALLLACAATALYAAYRLPGDGPRTVLSCAGGLALLAATGGVLRTVTPSPQWWPAAHLLCAAALLTAAVARRTRRGRLRALAPLARGLRLAALAVGGAAVLWTTPATLQALYGPLSWSAGIWTGAPERVRDALTPGVPWLGGGSVAAVAALVAATAAAAWRLLPRTHPWRAPARGTAPVAAAVTAALLPAALDLGYAVAVAWLLALAVAPLAGYAVLGRPNGRAAAASWRGPAAAACPAAALALTPAPLGLALAGRTATLLVLAVLTLAFAGAALAAVRSGTPGRLPAVPACAAVAAAAGLGWALAMTAELPPRHAAFALLAVAFAVLGAASAARRRPELCRPLEGAAACVAATGLLAASGSAAWLSLALALCGLAAGALALRADRRPVAAVVSAVLLLCAAWARLYASEVTVPEAYTLPVTLLALPLGHLRRRGAERASSWTAYAPGLAATALPGTVAVWGDPGWLRPLLLGAAALAVTLWGARLALQAPLLLGGATLAAVALHELAPYLARMAGVLPRWLPLAVAGALLLAVGATYEKRLREVRRLRARIGRMS
ncbi:hypothetical protein [Streptomyces sp. HNM0574]|uniref:SCO7613 C-terminal domain-containing membrane protein n=1 Tax=Streptomyces sp. HNM0574 TaxID=2714954 RepID=UPI00146E2827|nr:hypothetical protein [Streptomyces sp. HNM0574]NLU66316.1 hypothetical protein [Streptomyces sp. HNM0574]